MEFANIFTLFVVPAIMALNGGEGVSRALVTTVYFFSLFGYAKAALMPLHNWLPSAMVAPTIPCVRMSM